MDPKVAEFAKLVRLLPFKKGNPTPFTCAFDPEKERRPGRRANVARKPARYLPKKVAASDKFSQQNAWLEQRHLTIEAMRAEIHADVPSYMLLEDFMSQLNQLMGITDEFSTELERSPFGLLLQSVDGNFGNGDYHSNYIKILTKGADYEEEPTGLHAFDAIERQEFFEDASDDDEGAALLGKPWQALQGHHTHPTQSLSDDDEGAALLGKLWQAAHGHHTHGANQPEIESPAMSLLLTATDSALSERKSSL